MPRSVLLLVGASVLLVATRGSAPAQQVAVSAGQRVRVEWIDAQRRHRTVGTVLELAKDSVALIGATDVRRFALGSLARIDVSVPRSRARGAARGAGIGALVGLGLGLAAGGYGAIDCRQVDGMCDLGLIVLPPFGGAAGLILGAVVGGASPGHRWQRVR
jgi:hypothetical protein